MKSIALCITGLRVQVSNLEQQVLELSERKSEFSLLFSMMTEQLVKGLESSYTQSLLPQSSLDLSLSASKSLSKTEGVCFTSCDLVM